MDTQVKKPVEKVKGKRGRKPRQSPVDNILSLINSLDSFDDLDRLAVEIINIRDNKKSSEIERLTAQLAKLQG
jgi:hypothetical protein